MNPEHALAATVAAFPFKGYFPSGSQPRGVYLTVARTVERLLPAGASILDFGCGPCDKTAVLSLMGFDCVGYDDLNDAWHLEADNRDRIRAFASLSRVELVEGPDLSVLGGREFDMIMSHDVLEHLHDSPRDLLEQLMALLRPGGVLYISVPNAVNLRKRLCVAAGRTNHAPFSDYYWYPGPWRGHVREYVKDDLRQLGESLGLESIEVGGCDHMLEAVTSSRVLKATWSLATARLDSLKDTVYLVGRKPTGWRPAPAPGEVVRRLLEPSL